MNPSSATSSNAAAPALGSALFDAEQHIEPEVTLGIYQRMVTACREPDRKFGKFAMRQLIDSLASVPLGLGRTAQARGGPGPARGRRS